MNKNLKKKLEEEQYWLGIDWAKEGVPAPTNKDHLKTILPLLREIKKVYMKDRKWERTITIRGKKRKRLRSFLTFIEELLEEK